MTHETSRASRLVGFLAVLFVGACLVPAGAHLAELPNKMNLADANYMVVQRIYSGWALFGIAVFGALGLTLAHAILVWREPRARWLSLLSFVAIAVTQAIFWTWTFPVNALTRNWTVTPENLELARRQWEYSHAVNAAITFAAFALIVLSVMLREVRAESGIKA